MEPFVSGQPRGISVDHNTMSEVGLVLASAAGIVASSVSASNFTDNNITGSPRWGIAIRSNGGASISCVARGSNSLDYYCSTNNPGCG